MKLQAFLCLLLILLSCKPEGTQNLTETSAPLPKKQRPIAVNNGKFFEHEGRQMLFGGKDSSSHFDISNISLVDSQFHYGIGRERFPALLEPAFISIAEADSSLADSSRFLLAIGKTETKAYSIKDLTRHEIVNDQLDGEPIMAAYCILADLGAIYSRQYGEQELTFALSGYTYYDDKVWEGLDGFVLWDRESESLWWPLIGKAVSGDLKGVKLLEMDTTKWKDTNWQEVKANYPTAKIMKSGQDYERPGSWQKLADPKAIRDEFGI